MKSEMLEEMVRNMDEIKDPSNKEVAPVDMMEVFSNLYGMKPSEYMHPKNAWDEDLLVPKTSLRIGDWNQEMNPVLENETDAEFKRLFCKYSLHLSKYSLHL